METTDLDLNSVNKVNCHKVRSGAVGRGEFTLAIVGGSSFLSLCFMSYLYSLTNLCL